MNHDRMPRTMNEAFRNPYAELHVEPTRYEVVRDWIMLTIWTLACGLMTGICAYIAIMVVAYFAQ